MSSSVLISGCSSGIGKACALHFDRAGWLVFAGVRREEDARRLEVEGSPRLHPLHLDITDPESIAAAAAKLSGQLGAAGLQGLVNNAGIARGGPLEYVPLDEFRRQFDVNVFGTLALTQAFLPLLHAGHGRIVNIGSIAGRVTTPLLGPYCASKHALEAMSDALRMELLPLGLYLSLVEPGVVDTPIWEKATRGGPSVIDRLPPVGQARYGGMGAALAQMLARAPRRAVPVEAVVRVVDHALTAARPRPRYLVGRDARVRLLLQSLLPRRWMDGLILRFFRRLAPRAA
ncbi:MAG TPA: SDR family NAD(P)-dependent oxidoreductase [Gemmatimonadales bacterium]